MSAVGDVLIVGGGIGGLSAAIAMAKAGIRCRVVEIQDHWSVYGVGIIQPANALRAYDAIGLADTCLERGFLYRRNRLYNAESEQIGERELPKMEGVRFHGSSGISRPVLNDILVGTATALGVDIRLGTTVERFEDRGGDVFVEFSDGTSDNFDLLVGADGLYSKIRHALFPDSPTPAFSGQGCWRVTFPRPREMTYSCAFFGFNKAGLIPLGETIMYMYVTTSEPGNPWMERESLPALLRERLADYKGFFADLRDSAVDPDAIVYKPLEYLFLQDPWYKGRVVLIGDAAHSTTPHHAQGAAMAVEDGVVLAELLQKTGTVEDLLGQFMTRRYERCKFVVESSLAVGRLEQQRGENASKEAIAISERVRHGLLAPA